MTKHNEKNERVKRDYFAYLKEAQRYSEQSVDAVAMAIARFEVATNYRDFAAFHHQQAISFKRSLVGQPNRRGTGKLSKSTITSTLSALRNFFHWLAGRPGFKSRFSYDDSEYFNPSDRDLRIAQAQRPRAVPSVEQVNHVVASMPYETVIDRRDRALIAFIVLTGCRDRAAVSIKLEHVDFEKGLVCQDARQVETKRGKTITTYFFPVGDEPLVILKEWLRELRTDHHWGPNDPLFPSTAMAHGDDAGFRAVGIERRHWSDAGPVRRIFKAAFAAAGLPYFQPHSFRHMLARLGEDLCRSPAEFKAWSQNLGHEQVLTTLNSYGRIEEHRQGEIIKALGQRPDKDGETKDLFDNLVALIKGR